MSPPHHNKGPFTSELTLRQLCDDASDTILIENIGGAPEWSCNPFSSDSIVFNENSIASVIAELLQRWADAWCKGSFILEQKRRQIFLLIFKGCFLSLLYVNSKLHYLWTHQKRRRFCSSIKEP